MDKDNEEHKKELYRIIFRILEPKMERLLHLKKVADDIRIVVCEVLRMWLGHDQGRSDRAVPELVSERLVELFDLLVQLDNLKDMKVSRQRFRCDCFLPRFTALVCAGEPAERLRALQAVGPAPMHVATPLCDRCVLASQVCGAHERRPRRARRQKVQRHNQGRQTRR